MQMEHPEEMTWYAASLVIGFIKVNHSGPIHVWENVILISAGNDAEAEIEAIRIGKEEELIDDGLTVDGIPAKRQFAGVRKIMRIDADGQQALDHGAEITYSEFEVPSMEELKQLAEGKPVLLRYEA